MRFCGVPLDILCVGRRYAGRFDAEQLAGIVGAQRPNQRGGRRATEARASAAAARGDILGRTTHWHTITK